MLEMQQTHTNNKRKKQRNHNRNLPTPRHKKLQTIKMKNRQKAYALKKDVPGLETYLSAERICGSP